MRRYDTERREFIAAAVPGLDSARRLASLTDEMLLDLAEGRAARSLPARTRWALVALGGYGSGALLPASDLDLLVVSDAPAATLRPFVEALLYPLWDAGLAVGHQVRSRREQVAAVRAELATLTATLTGRAIAGDKALAEEVLGACACDAAKRADRVLGEMHARPRPSSPYLLEPDLKEGAGGRRDYDELTWTAAVLTSAPQRDPQALVSLGLLTADEYAALDVAAATVTAARWELQLAAEATAGRANGGRVTGGGVAGGSFMAEEAAVDLASVTATDVQHALADTHHLLLRVRARVAARAGTRGRRRGWSVRDITAVRGAASGSAPDTSATPPAPADTPLPALDALALLRRGPDALPALEDAAWAGRLDHLVPGMRELMWLRRPGIAHVRTVGAHSLACATHAAAILTEPQHRRVFDPDALLVAALAHDIGKVEPGPDHGERGAPVAADVARRFGLHDAAAAHVAALVRDHLFLSETAAQSDLDDPAAIAAAADVLGDRELLAPLHVLTIADSLATGPGAWSEWHATLVGALVRGLERELFLADAPADATTAAPSSAGDPRFDALAARVASDPTPGAHALDITPGPVDGSFRVAVAAHDRPGVLATLAGTFALAGLDILTARSVPARTGVTVDTFVVASATLAPIGPETWNRLERTLAAALAGRFALAVRLAERRRHYAPRVAGALDARIDDHVPGGATLRVRAPDRVGLLHDIARAIAESGLDVRGLTATSRAGWAEDTFRIALAEGTGAGALGQLQMRLREL